MPFFLGRADELNMGTRVMLSTPAAMTKSFTPDITACTAKCSACCEEPHWRSDGGAGHRERQLRRQHGVERPQIVDLLAHLHDATHDDVFHLRGVHAAAIHQRVDHLRGEIHRMPAGQAPARRPPTARVAATIYASAMSIVPRS